MQINDSILKNEEKVVMRLREMYRMYGYSCFKMSKFEEYELYSRNKDFLVSDRVITFNDTDGKLIALKPDVTLSIVKNFKACGGVQRVYYNENVYRVSDKTHGFKEIMQTGLECLGEVTEYDLIEVLTLAAKSIKSISESCVLSISDLDVISLAIEGVSDKAKVKEILNALDGKNADGVYTAAIEGGLAEKEALFLSKLTSGYGESDEVIEKISGYTDNPKILEALNRLGAVVSRVKSSVDIAVRVDLSLTSDMNYYNGLVFRGFVEGIPTSVLSGGQYDLLMKKLSKSARAIGFAVYLDQLERLDNTTPYDVDVVLLYNQNDDTDEVSKRVTELVSSGKSVSAQTSLPDKLHYGKIEYLGQGGNL